MAGFAPRRSGAPARPARGSVFHGGPGGLPSWHQTGPRTCRYHNRQDRRAPFPATA